MLTVADHAQRGFFDASWCGDLLPADSIYSLLAEHGHRIVRDEDFAECYADRTARPSIPPSMLAKVLLLAYRDGLSDERAMEALRFDLRWKVALDLPVDHPGFHSTSLVRFRARLLLHGRERLVFERSLCLAKELGLVDEATEQIVDWTPMLGAAAAQDTVSGVRKLIDAVKPTISRRSFAASATASSAASSSSSSTARSARSASLATSPRSASREALSRQSPSGFSRGRE